MGDLSGLVSKESGRYRYVIFNREGIHSLAVGNVYESYDEIGIKFLVKKGQQVTGFELRQDKTNLGVRTGGVLDWEKEKEHVTFYAGAPYVKPLKSEVDELMKNTGIRYDAPLDYVEGSNGPHESVLAPGFDGYYFNS